MQSKIIADHSWRYELEYVWIFFCGLTNAFASHFQELYNSTYKIPIDLVDDTLRKVHFHCIYEAQSSSTQGEIKSALNYVMSLTNNVLIISSMTLSSFDIHAIAYVMSLSPGELNCIVLVVINQADIGISFLFVTLAKLNITFPNLTNLHIHEVHDRLEVDTSSVEHLKNFFEHSPKLSGLVLSHVSGSLAKIVSYVPHRFEVINLQHMDFDEADGITPFSIIKAHPPLYHLFMYDCQLTDKDIAGVNEWIQLWPARKLDTFSLGYNSITNEGATVLAQSICNSITITGTHWCGPTTVDLRSNIIGCEGLLHFIRAAKACLIREKTFILDFRYNAIKDSDVDYNYSCNL